MKTNIIRKLQHETRGGVVDNRRGIFLVITAIGIVAVMSFMALSVDLGVITLTKTNLQNCADAAALAAAQEIMVAIKTAGDEVEEGQTMPDINALAVESAKDMALKVVELNGFYIDKDADVSFGKRSYNEDTEEFEIEWGTAPYSSGSFNVVKVRVRMDNPDANAPDAQLQLFFAGISSDDAVSLAAEAIAFVEARDIAVVMDYSGSMNDDSCYRSINKLSQTSIEENMTDIIDALEINIGTMTNEPTYLKVTETKDGLTATCTFKNTEVFVECSEAYHEVTLEFSDGIQETFEVLTETSGTHTGTGDNTGKTIDHVWVKRIGEGEEVTVQGSNPTKKSLPYIEVTFKNGSIFVESTKDLSNVVLEFEDGTHYKFDDLNGGQTGTFEGVGDYEGAHIVGCWVKSGTNHSGDGPGYGERFDNPNSAETSSTTITIQMDDTVQNVIEYYELDEVTWPYPSGTWDSFVHHCRINSKIRNAGYRRMYGGWCLVDYLLEKQALYNRCPDLWKTPHYPFHAAKNGTSLFCEFLEGLEFGDYLGLVTYATYSKIQTELNDEHTETTVDLGEDWLTSDYEKIDTIQRHKQASHFANTTGIGYGMEDAITLLESKGRIGARHTIVLMTDGLANQSPDDFVMPNDWNWAELTDYDGDGVADYTTDNRHKQYLFYQVKRAVDLDYVIHTMSVGVGADRDLMKAVAFAGSGEWIDVPGGSTIAEMEDQMLSAFTQIAADVPPPKLLLDPGDLSY